MMDFHVVSFQKTLIEYKLLVVHMFDEHTTNVTMKASLDLLHLMLIFLLV
jgi:hypothetical protein